MGFSRQEYWSGVPLPSPIKEARVVERKFAFGFWQPLGREHACPKATPPPYPPHTYTDSQGARNFIDGGRGLHAETAQLALTFTLKLVIGGLTSVILFVLGTVNL